MGRVLLSPLKGFETRRGPIYADQVGGLTKRSLAAALTGKQRFTKRSVRREPRINADLRGWDYKTNRQRSRQIRNWVRIAGRSRQAKPPVAPFKNKVRAGASAYPTPLQNEPTFDKRAVRSASRARSRQTEPSVLPFTKRSVRRLRSWSFPLPARAGARTGV